MKICLIYPGLAFWGWNSYYATPNFDNMDTVLPPYGLCSIGGSLRQHGHEVAYIDLRFLKDWQDFAHKLRTENPDACGIGFQTPNLEFAVQCGRIIKEVLKVPVIAGGIHCSIMPEETYQLGSFDYIITGEAEKSLPALLAMLSVGERPPAPIITGETIDNLDDLPFPYYSDLYLDKVIRKMKVGFILTSRGCPSNCKFCQPVTKRVFGNKVRMRSISNIIDEIRYYGTQWQINKFFILDDMFTISKKRVIDFCRILIDQQLNITYDINCRVDHFDEEMAELLDMSGCNLVCFGFESGSQHALDTMGKNTTVAKNYQAARIWKQRNKLLIANILTGFPGETAADMKSNHAFILAIAPDIFRHNLFVPYPGTHFYNYCREHNLLAAEVPFRDFEMNTARRKQLIKNVDYDRILWWGDKTQFFMDLQKGVHFTRFARCRKLLQYSYYPIFRIMRWVKNRLQL